jgi:hypothetical protein
MEHLTAMYFVLWDGKDGACFWCKGSHVSDLSSRERHLCLSTYHQSFLSCIFLLALATERSRERYFMTVTEVLDWNDRFCEKRIVLWVAFAETTERGGEVDAVSKTIVSI